MSDHEPGHDPIRDRLRATLNAERADIERRLVANGPASTARPNRRWIPLAVAAAVIAIAGLFFITYRNNDDAVDLDVAGQTEVPATPPSPATATPQRVGPLVGEIPHISGEKYCDTDLDLTSTMIAWAGPDEAVPLAIVPTIGTDPVLLRTALSGSPLELAGGCTASASPEGLVTWVEVLGSTNGWVRTEFLITQDEYDQKVGTNDPSTEPNIERPAPAGNNCQATIEMPAPRFVWGIGVDDADGGLVAHTAPAVDAPITRVVEANAVVELSGGCALSPNGTPWYELTMDTGYDWVNGRFLVAPRNACFFGDTPESSPDKPPDQRQFGPTEGLAFEVGDTVAFAELESKTYRFYGQSRVGIDVPCYLAGPTGPICLTGDYQLLDLYQPGTIAAGQGPHNATRTGRTYSDIDRRGLAEPVIEVLINNDTGTLVTGVIDPTLTAFAEGSCAAHPSTSDSLDQQPCAITPSDAQTGFRVIGSSASAADHFHDIRVQQNNLCVRVVAELGIGVFTPQDVAVDVVPQMQLVEDGRSTSVSFPDCDQQNPCAPVVGENETDRVDFDGGTAFVSLDDNGQASLTVLYEPGITNVTLLESPARMMIDWQPTPVPGLFGPLPLRHAILVERVHRVTTTSAMAQPTSRIINGWARPFEAFGQWYIFELAANGELPSTPTAVATGPMPTTGWIDGWGAFAVTLPDLDEGDYMVLFGETPPTDGPEFVGSGERIRVSNDPDAEAPSWDPIVDHIEIIGPIQIND